MSSRKPEQLSQVSCLDVTGRYAGMLDLSVEVYDAELKQSELLQINLKTSKTKLGNSVEVMVSA